MNRPGYVILITMLLAAYVNSCKKAEVDSDTQAAEDAVVAESAFNQIGPTVVEMGIKEEGVKKRASVYGNIACAQITLEQVDSNTFPKTLTIDFGTGCSDLDGRVRKGKIKAVFSDRWSNTGASVTVSLENYYMDNVNYQGTLTLTNNGSHSYSQKVDDGKCIASDWNIEFEGDKTVKWVTGFDTDSVGSDDVFEVTGSMSGVNRKGRKFSGSITKALRKEMSCKHIVSGTVEITPEGLATRTIDFGDGTCDDKATATINGNVFNITMK